MSTRANIIIKDNYSHLYFYRHSDGYPEGVQGSLLKFRDWLRDGKIRNNVGQGSGWLILLGALEYEEYTNIHKMLSLDSYDQVPPPTDWKVGAYEPTTGLHGDIEHLYLIDMKAMTVSELKIEWTKEDISKEWEKFEVINILEHKQFKEKAKG